MKDLGSVYQCLGIKVELMRVNHRLNINHTHHLTTMVYNQYATLSYGPMSSQNILNRFKMIFRLYELL